MIKLNPMDNEAKVVLPIKTDMLKLLNESEVTAMHMGYIHDLRCFCNYLIAHYEGNWNKNSTKYSVSYPLTRL